MAERHVDVEAVPVEAVPGAALAVDADRRVCALNRAAVSLIGWRPAELLGRPCAEALDVRRGGRRVWADGWHPSASLATVRGLPELALTVRRADGTDLDVVATGRYLRAPGGALEGAVVALRPARRPDTGPGAIEIVSTVSHELRSPLTSVKGYTSLMLNRWERLADEQKKMMLEQVNHDADRVTRLITELLDISRLETGRLVLRRQLVELRDLTATVVGKVALEYPDLDATVTVADDVAKVYADPDKLVQVLTNLVENACKYASPTGLRIDVAVAEGAAVAVTVTDRGEGIPADDLPKVFTRFFRRSEGKPTGSGLGLWISRGLVEAHGGALTATSTVGTGSAFRFTIPHVDLEELQAQ
ncbi:MAG TPA: ATP-binding protein [Acidimicrobiales bacterium]|nr:ATP-binding protein [Acidimicrobiales bacterium]